MIHTYKEETISFSITYKKRAAIGMSIDAYGNLEVQAPKNTPEAYIRLVLEEKWDWIQEKSKEMKERLQGPQEKVYGAGEKFLYLGKPYPMELSPEAGIVQDQVIFTGDSLHVHVRQVTDDHVKQALKRFYYQQCKAIVEKRIAVHQAHFKTKPRSVRITDSQRTWGTCNSNFELTFNWRLAMAPLDVIDYVVVHEMCHMVHMNHDRSFWRLVGKLMPDYKEKEKWLALSNWKMTV